MATLIYIGNLPSMDTNEYNYTSENPSAVYGTYGSDDMQVVDVTMSENNDAGRTYDDDWNQTADTFTYDTGSGAQSSGLDAQARFRATIVEGDGSSSSQAISVYQLQNGDTFIRLQDGFRIQEVTITSILSDGYYDIRADASSSSIVVCFEANTGILTPTGERPARKLRVGDRVVTLDHGAQRIVWRHSTSRITTVNSAPVVISAGALGCGNPKRDLVVSPQHRILVRSKVVKNHLGHSEVIVSAKKLLGFDGIDRAPSHQNIHYVHFCTTHHDVVLANGAAAETFMPGPIGIASLDPRSRDRLERLCRRGKVRSGAIRPTPTGKKLWRVLSKIKESGFPLVEEAPQKALGLSGA